VVIVPELEEWLWHDKDAIGQHVRADAHTLADWIADFARKDDRSPEEMIARHPKEALEHVMGKGRRTTSARYYEAIAQSAHLDCWQNSPSFAELTAVLRNWFPPTP
jgi:hypothetical protein